MSHVDPVVKRLQIYDPASVLMLLSASAAYPPNALFLERFEYLVNKVTSIAQFDGVRRATSNDLTRILSSIPSGDEQRLAALEDFVPTDNLDDVQVCWNRRQWRFFFGKLERPLAYLEKLISEAFVLDEWILSEYGFSFRSVLDFTLAFHDHLLRNLVSYFRDAEDSDSQNPQDLVLPPNEFIEFWRSISPTTTDDFMHFATNHNETLTWMRRFTKTIGADGVESTDTLHPLSLSTFIAFDDYLFVPLPQLGVEQLLNQLTSLVEQMKQYRPEMAERFRNYTCDQSIRSSFRLFAAGPSASVLPNVEITSGDLSVALPLIVPIDTDKVLLYEVATSLGSQEDLNQVVEDGISRLATAKSIFEPGDELRVTLRPRGGSADQLVIQPGALEAICILIVNVLGLDDHFVALSREVTGVFERLSLLSYEALARDFESGLEFIKFLRARGQLKNEVHSLVAWDILDSYSWYRGNRHTFLRQGIIPNIILFGAHSWSWEEHKQLVSAVETHRILCEEGIPDTVIVHPDQSDAWRLFDPVSQHGWMIIPASGSKDRLVLHIATDAGNADEIELNESLVEGLSYHVERLGRVFWDFCRDELLFHWSRIEVLLHSDEVVRENLHSEALMAALERAPNTAVVATSTMRRNRGRLQPLLAIIYRADALRQMLMGSDNRAERQFVEAFLHGLASLSNDEGQYSIQVIRDFLDEHLPLGKKAISMTEIDTLQTRPNMSEPRALSEADTSWTEMMIARHLREQGVRPGLYTGEDAITINTEVISPFVMQLLIEAISLHATSDLILWTYGQLEQTESYRSLHRKKVLADYRDIHLKYDPSERLVEVETRLASQSEALALLLEVIVKHQPAGSLRLSWERWDRLFALTHSLFLVVTTDELSRFGLRPMGLRVDEDYAFSLEALGEYAVDLESYQLGRAKAHLPSHYTRSQDKANAQDAAQQTLLSTRPELTGISEAFERDLGVNLEDFMVVQLGLASFPMESTNSVGQLVVDSQEAICHVVGEIVQFLPKETCTLVLQQLTLTPAQMATVQINPRKQREREKRLAAQPLILTTWEGQAVLVFGPWFVERTLHLWQNYLDEGRTPLRDEDVPSALRTALEAYRQQRNAEFERSVREFVGQLGLQVIRSKDKELTHSLGLSEEKNPGEIDALVIASAEKQVFVLEIKDVAQSTTPRQIAREFRKFFEGSNSYVNQLQRKYDFVRSYLPGTVQWFGLQYDDTWNVVGAFVTRNLVPSAFSAQSPFAFVAFDELASWLVPEVTGHVESANQDRSFDPDNHT